MVNTVSFPLLSLKINVSKIAFSIFGISIYWYAVIIVFGIITALFVLKKIDKLYGIEYNQILDLVIFMLPISIISARIYYILFKLDTYILNPASMLDFRSGGLAIYGGIIGGIITCIVYCKIKKINILDILDYLAPALTIAQSIGRWGNFVNIEAYGSKTTLPWRMGIYEIGEYIEVHPTFLYESICTFVIFLILIKLQNNRKFKGEIASIYLILYSFARFFIEGLRTDSLLVGQFRISQLLSVIIFMLSIGYFIYNSNKNRKQEKKE